MFLSICWQLLMDLFQQPQNDIFTMLNNNSIIGTLHMQ